MRNIETENRIQKEAETTLSPTERINAMAMILQFDDISKRYDNLQQKDRAQIEQCLMLAGKVNEDQMLEGLAKELKDLMIKKLDCPTGWFSEVSLHQIYEARIKQIQSEAGEKEELDPNAPSPRKKYTN